MFGIESNFSNHGTTKYYYSDMEIIKVALNNYISHDSFLIINVCLVVICLLGLVGNGIVIWLLGFRIKRNPFTTYILNLSIADFGVVLSLMITVIFIIVIAVYIRNDIVLLFFLVFLDLFFFTYSTGQFLLAAISIDRCVAVLFPLWHRFHQPPRLPTIVCALIWTLSFLLSAIHFTLQITGNVGNFSLLLHLAVNGLLCTPFILISTLTLFIQVCRKLKQRKWGKLVMATLVALLFFLLFAFPMNVFFVIHFYSLDHIDLLVTGFACSSLNSSINPLIYFLVGRRQKKGQPRVSMKVALQRVFDDEQDCVQEHKMMSKPQA